LAKFRKFKRFLNYFLGPFLFIVIGYSIYNQLSNNSQLSNSWVHVQEIIAYKNKGLLITALLLMAVNWGLEAKKWQILTSHVQKTSYFTAFKSVMAGVSFTMLTPNRMGEFLGRVLYLADGSRVRAAVLMMLSSISQLAVTIFMGIAGLFILFEITPVLKHNTQGWTDILFNTLLWGGIGSLLVSLIIFFNLGWFIRIFEKTPPFHKYYHYIQAIGEIQYQELLKLLFLSALRYSVFMGQYILVFHFFEAEISTTGLWAATAVMFYLLAIIPTIALAELGIRGQISIFVFGLLSQNQVEILVAAATIWLINIIFPAIAGSFMLLSVRLFKKD
jgi:hypothetical protein